MPWSDLRPVKMRKTLGWETDADASSEMSERKVQPSWPPNKAEGERLELIAAKLSYPTFQGSQEELLRKYRRYQQASAEAAEKQRQTEEKARKREQSS